MALVRFCGAKRFNLMSGSGRLGLQVFRAYSIWVNEL